MRTHVRKRVAVAMTGAGLALAGFAAPAQAAPMVQISSTSLVLADGAAVAILVKVSCDPGTNPNVSVQISQRSGRQIASAGGGESDFVCDGAPHVVQVIFAAQGLAFSTGVAFVTANVFSCITFPPPFPFPGPSTNGCNARASRTIRLVPGVIQGASQL